MLDLQLDIITISLLGASLFLVVVILLMMLPPLRKISRKVAADNAAEFSEEGEEGIVVSENGSYTSFPTVSIIVHTLSDASNLGVMLPMLLEQDYPEAYEVIVVNDGSDEHVSDVVGRLEMQYSNLYMTFAPAKSRNLSRRKLAITLGVKASRYDVVVVTGGNCSIVSDQWLRLLMKHMARGKEVVTGYDYVVASSEARSRVGRVASFDEVRTAVEYLNSALRGRMYRASGFNYAFRRYLFFENKGFSGSLNFKYGDDDIFISSIANKENTAVELSHDSMVAVIEEDPSQAHRLDKLRHDFTGRYVSHRWRRYFGFSSLLWWIWTGVSATAIAVSVPNLIPAIAVFVIMWLLFLPVMVAWKKCSVSLCGRPLFLTVPWLIWIHPFYTLYYRIKGRMKRKHNYTWSMAIH